MLMLMYAIILAQFGLGWVFIRYLIQQDRGPKEPTKALIVAGVLGFIAVGIAMFSEAKLVPQSIVEHTVAASNSDLLRAALTVGILEEGAKSLFLAIFLYGKKYFDEMTDGVIYFGIAGMVFGVVENMGYALSYGPAVGVMRFAVAPFIHAAFCALFGWTLAYQRVRRSSWAIVALGALAAIGLHTVYDYWLFTQQPWNSLAALVLAIALNFGVFGLLRIAQRMDSKMGLATHGNNLYCRACGQPNPKRYMYCTSCGGRT